MGKSVGIAFHSIITDAFPKTKKTKTCRVNSMPAQCKFYSFTNPQPPLPQNRKKIMLIISNQGAECLLLGPPAPPPPPSPSRL